MPLVFASIELAGRLPRKFIWKAAVVSDVNWNSGVVSPAVAERAGAFVVREEEVEDGGRVQGRLG